MAFKVLITTNYDSLIEQAYYGIRKQFAPVITFDNGRAIAYNLWENKFFILKAHGDVKINLSRLVLTEKDYRNINI
ncbi:hypothetical protein FM036_44305 [Nostoc sp. HG1]|nr:hypothetical protein [Nostoc sp. HG1]